MKSRRAIAFGLFLIGLLFAFWFAHRLSDADQGRSLRKAAFKGDLAAVQQIVRRNPSVVNSVQGPDSPSKGKPTFIRTLFMEFAQFVSRGEFEAWNNARYSALDLAVRADHLEVVKFLLAAGADPHRLNGNNYNAIHQAVQRGNIAMVREFIASAVSLETRDGSGTTPLGWAALTKNGEMVSLLIKAGAHVNGGQMPPLHWAAEVNHYGIAEMLILHGADVNCNDAWKRTPLMVAKNRDPVASLLRRHGAVEDSQALPTP